jgi:hypothetical protein
MQRTYITGLPEKETNLPDWQVAIDALMLVSRSGPTMLARTAIKKALNRNVPKVLNPERTAHHQ